MKLPLVRILYLLFLGNLTGVDRADRAESVQGKHRWKKAYWDLIDIAMLIFHIALETQVVREYELLLLWKMTTWNEYFHTKHTFHMPSDPYFSQVIEWKTNQTQYFSTVYPCIPQKQAHFVYSNHSFVHSPAEDIASSQ